ncbi:hypothetical protein LCGC14_1507330 [marine sediment metagenome]|uniref:Uncharacterized protein n=1 Tax=marine sediment metagenome TaxID=412755 RepID=A0A0F9J2S8_9ZZZZ
MKAGMEKPGHKYKSRKKIKGKWIYDYGDGKKMVMKEPKRKEREVKLTVHKKKVDVKAVGLALKREKPVKKGTAVSKKEKPKVIGFYPDGRNKYFKTEADKKLFLKRQKEKSLIAATEEHLQKVLLKQPEKKPEVGTLKERLKEEKIKEQANGLVMAHWDQFQDIVGGYYKSRARGGWDASQYGYDVEDLKADVFIALHGAAKSYLSRSEKVKVKATFKSYVLGFLHSHMVGKLAEGTGMGGHLKASYKDLFYLTFYKQTLSDYRDAHDGRTPSNLGMLKLLEERREDLPATKGNMTVKNYKWTLEKVENKKALAREITHLDRVIDVGHGKKAILGDLIDERLLNIPGHYKVDPWQETAKAVVMQGVRDSIKRVFPKNIDREILIRKYGLFVDENDPPEVREYAPGWDETDIANWINEGPAKGKRKKWTSAMVGEKVPRLLAKLEKDKRFKRELAGFVKSEGKSAEWSDTAVVIRWISLWYIVKEAFRQMFGGMPEEFMDDEEPKISLNDGFDKQRFRKIKGLS